MNRHHLVAFAAAALVLAACADGPRWNASVFPQQPEYGVAVMQSASTQTPAK